MKQGRFELRIDEDELSSWREKAADEGMKLAAWIRERCNGSEAEAVRKDRGVHMASGRTNPAKRVEGGIPQPEGLSGQFASCGHSLEHSGKCGKWGCPNYAFER